MYVIKRTLKITKYYLMAWQTANSPIYNMGSTANLWFPTGAAQVRCFDATGCVGNETAVNTARECCLGSGLSFQNGGTCRQCIGKQLIIFLSNLMQAISTLLLSVTS